VDAWSAAKSLRWTFRVQISGQKTQRVVSGLPTSDFSSMTYSAQVWQRDVGYGVDIGALEQYGIPLTPLVKALDKATLDW
jgi:hypothetical protein